MASVGRRDGAEKATGVQMGVNGGQAYAKVPHLRGPASHGTCRVPTASAALILFCTKQTEAWNRKGICPRSNNLVGLEPGLELGSSGFVSYVWFPHVLRVSRRLLGVEVFVQANTHVYLITQLWLEEGSVDKHSCPVQNPVSGPCALPMEVTLVLLNCLPHPSVIIAFYPLK